MAAVKNLSQLEQVKLGIRIQQGDEEAVNQLVEGTMDLVNRKVNQINLTNVNINKEDLIQEGYLGLIQAAKNFDPLKGLNFTGYASFYVFKFIFHFMDTNQNTINIPASRSGINRKILKLMEELEAEGVEVSTNYLLLHELVSENDINNFLLSVQNGDSDEDYLSEDGDSIYDITEDEASLPADALLIQRIRKERVLQLLEVLDNKTQLIIKSFYGIGCDPLSCEEIAEQHQNELGFKTRQRVHQLLKEGITTIQKKLYDNEN